MKNLNLEDNQEKFVKGLLSFLDKAPLNKWKTVSKGEYEIAPDKGYEWVHNRVCKLKAGSYLILFEGIETRRYVLDDRTIPSHYSGVLSVKDSRELLLDCYRSGETNKFFETKQAQIYKYEEKELAKEEKKEKLKEKESARRLAKKRNRLLDKLT